MKRFAVSLAALALSLFLLSQTARAVDQTWKNTSGNTDFNSGTSWVSGTPPGLGDRAIFAAAAVAQPNLSASLSIASLDFSTAASSGYDLTSSSTAIALTLTSTATGASGAINSAITSLTNTIDAPIILGAAAASVQTITQSGGGTLVLNGVISSTNSITLSYGSTGTFQINGANTYTGTTSTAASSTLVVGNTGAFGSTILNFGGATPTIQAGIDLTGANKLTNAITDNTSNTTTGLTIANTPALGIEFGGTFDLQGATRTITNSNTGGTIISGVIGNDAGGGLVLKNSGTLTLTNANTYTGGTTLSGGGNFLLGNDSALGTGTFTVATTSGSTISASGGARNISNATVLAINSNIGGSNNITFSGSFTSSGSNTRTLTVNNSGITTLSGNVFLSDNNTSVGRVFTIGGSGATTISGVITNNNAGNTLAAGLTYSGTNTLTLSNTNTYTGNTVISNGSVIASKDGALGGGNVSLTGSAVMLTLQGGATQNYIADTGTLSIAVGTVFLNFSGTDTINALVIGGMNEAAGQWGAVGSGAANENAAFTGAGFVNVLTVIPEPATYMLIGLGALVCAQQFRKRKKA